MKMEERLRSCGEAEKQAIMDDLLQSVDLRLLDAVNTPLFGGNRRSLLMRAIFVIDQVLDQATKMGLFAGKVDPGHGKGHMMRDYLNALRLFSRLEGDERQIFIGLLGGVLHDLGCAIVDRYSESHLVFRHAEMSAIALHLIFQEDDCGLNPGEQKLLQYAVMAHTHYLKPQTVTLADGQTKVILPYKDTEDDGTPWFFVWYTRWVDRLDCTGPCFPARHYLNLVNPHKDFSSSHGFYDVEFEQHMRPLLRDEFVKPLTMLEHLQMFANSMNNNSPYGKNDYGYMVTLRDEYTGYMRDIIRVVSENTKHFALEVDGVWEAFLRERIEPSEAGAEAAEKLEKMFKSLPNESQVAWIYGFNAIRRNYEQWSSRLVCDLDECCNPWTRFPLLKENLVGVLLG